jgi:hypothetical protein
MRLTPALFVALLCAGSVRAHARPEAEWGVDEKDHFFFHHESPGSDLGEYNRFERIYASLRRELWSLVPWMTEQKNRIYLYNDRESYLGGRFHPPEWSGGLLSTGGGEKALAVYAPVDPEVVAHELTHLYFHVYFEEKGALPPSWLDEGLAGMLQSEALELPDSRYKGPVVSEWMPIEEFVLSRPGRDSPQARVGAWYQQAHSYVRFLKREHIETKFVDFCARLRGGQDVKTALRDAYDYPSLQAFEAAWLKWRPRRAVGVPVGLE